MALFNATSKDFATLTEKGLVLVDFHASWCGPCRMLSPTLDVLASEYDGKASIVKVDVDESPELAANYGVMGIPTLLVIKDGEVVETMTGFLPKEALSSKLDANL